MSDLTESPPVRHSALEASHLEHGATLTEYAGWRLPLRFSGELEEHRAVRETCGLFDISHMGQLVVTGSGAAEGLAGAVVGDIARLEIGAARYTMICNGRGGVLDDLIVYRLAGDEFLVIANAANTAVVTSELENRIGRYDAGLRDRTEERALISLQGPRAVELMSSLLGEVVDLPERFHAITIGIGDATVLLARTGYTGEDGFELSLDRHSALQLWERLLDGTPAVSPVPVGLAARDSLRLEAGLPLYGHELDANRTPFEAGFGWTVDLDHDFVGDAALRRAAETESEERLVGLVSTGQRAPRQGYAVLNGDGQRVGTVTSGAPSPTLGRPIAMAYVLRSSGLPGTMLNVDVRGRLEQAEIVKLPFWRRPRPNR